MALLLLMVIRFVAHSDFLCLDFSSQFAVHLQASAGSGQRVILEDPAHVVEQVGDRQHDRGWTEVILPFQEELCVLVSLSGGTAEPVYRLGLVMSYSLPCQVQLAQHVLGVLISCLRRLGEPIRRSDGVLVDGVSLQILFAQPVGGPLVPVLHCLVQPTDALLQVPHFPIIREKQLAQGVLGLGQATICRMGEPVFRFLTVWDQQRIVPVKLTQQVLGVGITSLRQPLQLLRRLVPACQRKGLVLDDLPQFPAIIGFTSHLLRFVMAGQVSVLEGDLPYADALCLLDDGVLDLPELLLLGEFFPLSGLVMVAALYITLEDASLPIALTDHRQLLQLIHDFVHSFLHRLGKVAVGLLALDCLQLSGQLFHLLLDLRN